MGQCQGGEGGVEVGGGVSNFWSVRYVVHCFRVVGGGVPGVVIDTVCIVLGCLLALCIC